MTRRSLSLTGLTKSYDGVRRAVDAIDLTIEAGEFVSFLGPSGSGKTTTLMMIAGFETPTAGAIRLGERPIAGVPPYERNIGMVFQNYALFPHMNVADNVGFPLRMRRIGGAVRRERIATALAKVGLADFARRFPRELSGGQQQRVALARALVFEPDLVLLDEPLGALDKALREQLQVELKRIHRELGVTMVYVTHDQSEAMTMSDRIAVFQAGRIEQVGTPVEVYFAPRTRFVASFVGDSNLFTGNVQDGGVFVPDLGRVAAAPVEASRDTQATVLMRPEILRLGPIDAARPRLTVEEIVNFGESVLVLGRVGTQLVRVRLPSLQAIGLKAGAVRALDWPEAHVHLLPG